MSSKSKFSRRSILKSGALLPMFSLGPLSKAMAHNELIKDRKPLLKIKQIETFVIRNPNDDVPSDELIEMPALGAVKGETGLGKRLNHASPSRFKGHQQTLLVKIQTDQGITGWGEAHAPAAPRVHQRVISDLLKPILLDQNALDILPLWEKMYSSQRMRGYATGFYTEAIAGIDIALWDMLGKYLEVPVYRLLGGKFRDSVPTYRSCSQPEDAAKAMEDGFSAVKSGFFKASGSDDFARIAALSEAVGKKGQVFIDSLGAFKLHEAIQVGRKLDELGNIGWFEDALLPEDVDRYPVLAEALDTPVCVGETYSNRFQFRDLFMKKGADVINPDVGLAAGINECKRIDDLAELFGVIWSAHVSSGFPPYVAASLHLMVATPNAVILEGGNIHNATSVFGSRGNIFLKNPIRFEPGYAYVPEGPGLGIDFDEERLKEVIVKES